MSMHTRLKSAADEIEQHMTTLDTDERREDWLCYCRHLHAIHRVVGSLRGLSVQIEADTLAPPGGVTRA